MYDTGARVQEIINLTPEAVNITSTPYTVRLLGKGKKYRVVPLMEAQILLLKQYMIPLQKVALKLDISASSVVNPR